MMQQFHLLTLAEVRRHLVGDARITSTTGCSSNEDPTTHLDSLDSLGHHVGVMHGDEGHPHTGHVPQLGGPDACMKVRQQRLKTTKMKLLFFDRLHGPAQLTTQGVSMVP